MPKLIVTVIGVTLLGVVANRISNDPKTDYYGYGGYGYGYGKYYGSGYYSYGEEYAKT